ncbi:MAG TPA: immunoglobulin domain-containing protein, partial [Lacunisphaera sp.]|nr:immunoglobulin domain-containing protein [Lacunisphaera sp.]
MTPLTAVVPRSLASKTRQALAWLLGFGLAVGTPAASTLTLAPGQNATLSATGGGPTPTLQWQISTDSGSNWSNLADAAPYSGVNTATLTLTAATSDLNHAQFRALITTDNVTSTSDPVTLTMVLPATTASPGLLWAPGFLVEEGNYRATPVQIADAVTSVAGGTYHTLHLKANGSLWAVGGNTSGQLGDGTNAKRIIPVQVATGVAQMAAGSEHTLFIKADGTLWAMGKNSNGQLGIGSIADSNTPVQVATGVAKVAASGNWSYFIKTDGTLWAMGENSNGQLGIGSTADSNTPVQVTSGVAAVHAGSQFNAFIIKTDGTLWGMGYNPYCQLGTGNSDSYSTPVQVAAGVASVATGLWHTLILKTDGTLWAAGYNSSGQLGDGTTQGRSTPVAVATGVAFVTAPPFGDFTQFIKTDGTLWAMGLNVYGQLGDGTTTNRISPVQVTSGVAAVATGTTHTLIRKTDGGLWTTGFNLYGQLGDGTTTLRTTPVQVATDVASVAALLQGYSTHFTRSDGSLWVMGGGTLGDGKTSPLRGLVATGVVAADMGVRGLFIKSDGTLWSAPGGQVPGVNGVMTVSAGEFDRTRVYLKSDGTLWRLADDNVSIPLASNVVAAKAGTGYVIYLKNDGTLWGGHFSDSSPFVSFGGGPSQVATNVVSISAGYGHFLFIKNDRSLWGQGTPPDGWGTGYWGQYATMPLQLENGVAFAAANLSHNVYLKNDGTLWTRGDGWGAGSGPAVQVDDGVVAAAAGAHYTGAAGGEGFTSYIKADGTLWSRDGVKGALGNPVQVAEGAMSVATGNNLAEMFIQQAGLGSLPAFTTSPQPTVSEYGQLLTLTADATGTGPIAYQWFKDNVAITGAIDSTFRITFPTPANDGTYTVTATNSAGTVTSDPAAVSVKARPVITWATPSAITVGTALDGTQLNATADVPGTFAYTPAAGYVPAFGPQILTATFTPTDTANYSIASAYRTLVVIGTPTTFALSATSFTYDGAAQGPVVIANPANATFTTGGTLSATNAGTYTANAVATGSFSGSNNSLTWTIAKATATVTLAGLAATYDGSSHAATATTNPSGKTVTFTYDGSPTPPTAPGTYAVAATIDDVNYAGSAAGSLVITDNGPVVTGLGATRNVIAPGANLTLSATVAATGTPTYQWYHDGRPVSGTNATLSLAAATYADAGAYWLVITNSAGTTRTHPLFVTVAPAATQLRAWGYLAEEITAIPQVYDDLVIVSGSAAVRRDGTAVALGITANSDYAPPAGLTNVVALAAENSYKLALKGDGTVVAWTDANYEQPTVPAGLDHVVAIAAGGAFFLALKNDGTVTVWSHDGIDVSAMVSVAANLANVVAIDAGFSHAVALKGDGTVMAWGSNYSGQATVPAGLGAVTAISALGDHTLALKSDGTVVAWGANSEGQRNVPAGLSGVVEISAGYMHSLARKNDGTIVSWGSHLSGEMPVPGDLDSVFSLKGGYFVSLALRDATNDAAPVINTQPASQPTLEESSLTLSVSASGAGPLTYQWRKNGTPVSGATAASLSFAALALTDAGSYDVVITNHFGSTTSAAAIVAVTPLPSINSLSALRHVLTPGQALNLSASASGTGTLLYQWIHNGVPLAGQTTTSLAIASTQSADAGWYAVDVTDANGTRRSAAIFVAIVPSRTEVVAWGDNVFGQTNVPSGLGTTISFATSDSSTLALKRDGTLVAWGGNFDGQTTIPSGLANVVAVAAAGTRALALKQDGTVVGWGGYGALTLPDNATRIVAIAQGYGHALAVRSGGTVIAWGSNSYGALNVPTNLTGVIAVAAGDKHSVALKSDGTVVAWGDNTYQQTNVPSGLSGVVAIAASYEHTLAVKSDGSVIGWGRNSNGQLSLPSGLTGVVGISTGNYDAIALKDDGTAQKWAGGSVGAPPSYAVGLIAVAIGAHHAVALRSAPDDTVPAITAHPASQTKMVGENVTFSVVASGGTAHLTYQWRKGGTPISGATASSFVLNGLTLANAGNYDVVVTDFLGATSSDAATLTVNSPPIITNLSPTRTMQLPGQALNLGVTATTSSTPTYQWIHNGRVIAGATAASYSIPVVLPEDSGWYAVTITDIHGTTRSAPMFVIVAPTQSQVLGWGSNGYGVTSIPADLNDAVALSSTGEQSLALKAGGTVVTWGQGSWNMQPMPSGLTGVVAVAVGYQHLMVLKSDGTVTEWGHGAGGGGYGMNGIVAISAGDRHSLVLKSDGTVVDWGLNSGFEITAPAGLTNVVAIAAGGRHDLALKGDGTVVGWGTNGASVPAGLANVVAIAAGAYHSLALKDDGTVVAWGTNDNGQSTVPAGLTGVVAIAAGAFHSLALKSDGSVVGWGNNVYGETLAPANLGNVSTITAGNGFSLALRDATLDNAPVINTQPASQAKAIGQPVTLSVSASGGTAPLAYQWRKNGVNVAGAVSATFTLPGFASADAGSYDVVVTNYLGSVISNAAVLTVRAARGDFNGDGKSDILWRHAIGGNVVFWLMNGATPQTVAEVTPVSTDWVICGTGDFNGDGQTDVIWRHKLGGNVVFWLMNGHVPQTVAEVTPVSTDWVISGTGDFNGDGQTDIVWRHNTGGNIVFWFMNGTTPASAVEITPVSTDWVITTTGDFNNDGKTDIVWRHSVGGNIVFWMMNGSSVQSS